MPFHRPTLPSLVRTAEADLDAELPGADARLPASNLNVLARVQAGGLHGLYGMQAWVADQILADTAEAEVLDRHAAIWGVARKPATAAAGYLVMTGVAGAAIPAGTLLERGDGVQYETAAEAVITAEMVPQYGGAGAGTAAVPVRALLPGAAGNAASVPLRLVSSLSGVASSGTAVLSGGADVEDDAGLRARLLARIQEPPHGGSSADYAAWARAVPGVTRAWVYPRHLGLGTVGLTFVMDGRADIIPTPAEVDTVRAHIEDERPVTSELVVFAPIPDPLMLTIRVAPDTSAVRAAVEAEVRAFLAAEAEPGGTLRLSRLRDAISAGAGEHSHDLLAPTADVVAAKGHIAVFGAFYWVP